MGRIDSLHTLSHIIDEARPVFEDDPAATAELDKHQARLEPIISSLIQEELDFDISFSNLIQQGE